MPYHTVKVKGGFKNVKDGKSTSKKPMTKENAMKQKIAIAISESKEKPSMKPKKQLSKRQKDLMKTHSEHHTKDHLDMMKKLMLKGFCFEQSHEMTQKKIGK